VYNQCVPPVVQYSVLVLGLQALPVAWHAILHDFHVVHLSSCITANMTVPQSQLTHTQAYCRLQPVKSIPHKGFCQGNLVRKKEENRNVTMLGGWLQIGWAAE
jgi:hypothetical protein